MGDGGGAGRGRPDGVDHHVVLAGQARAGHLGAEALGGGEPGRRQVGHLDPARPAGQRRRGAQQPDGAAPDDGDPSASRRPRRPAGQVPGVDGVGGGLDQRRRLPRQPRRQRAERRRGHGDALGETAGAVHTDDLPLPAYVAQPAPAFRAAAAGEDGVDHHRLAPGAIPANSCPMISGGCRNPGRRAPCSSLPQIPAARTSTTTSPGAGSGSGTSSSSTCARRREDERLHRAAPYVCMVARLSVDRDGTGLAGRDDGRPGSRYAPLQRL